MKKEMEPRTKIALDKSVEFAITGLIGQQCCRQRVGRARSLSLGFGKKIPHGNPKLVDTFYGEWEIGTYSSAWRVTQLGKIICGSQEAVDSLLELDEQLNKIHLGRIIGIYMTTKFDIRVDIEDGIAIDILAASSEDDEAYHIFCPNGLYARYSISAGWEVESRHQT